MATDVRIKLLAAALGMAVAGSAAAVTTHPAMVSLGHAPALHKGETLIGPLSSTQPLHVEVALKLRNQTQLHSFIASAHSSSRLVAQRTMSAQQFRANHAPPTCARPASPTSGSRRIACWSPPTALPTWLRRPSAPSSPRCATSMAALPS